MQLLSKFFGRPPLLDEVLDDLKFVFRTCLESARVVEYKPRVGREYELVFDVVVSALNQSEQAVEDYRRNERTSAVGERIGGCDVNARLGTI